jgi:hypothetical protein
MTLMSDKFLIVAGYVATVTDYAPLQEGRKMDEKRREEVPPFFLRGST